MSFFFLSYERIADRIVCGSKRYKRKGGLQKCYKVPCEIS